MKKIITSFALMLAITSANAQTAVNWTAPDCSSVNHTLFTELDAGKIIVFIWVMPCGSCVNGAKAAYNAAQSFATSHPGKVLFYIADDYGDGSPCSTLPTWITTNSIGTLSNMTIFSNAGNVINMNDFGGPGMPQVVVMGGTDHKIYYNKKNSLTNDLSGITAAVNTAISATSATEVVKNTDVSITPNPMNETLRVTYNGAVKSIMVTSVSGQVVHEVNYAGGQMNPTVSLPDVAAGMYIIKIVGMDGKSYVKEIAKQ